MNFWIELAVQTLRDPRGTSEQIMDWQIDRNTLYIALGAVCALTALLVGTTQAIRPPTDPELIQAVPALALLDRPLALFVLTAGSLVVMIHALFWAGRAMGSDGALSDLLVLMIWLQALRLAAQLGVFVLSAVVPAIGGLVAIAVMITAFWLMLHFISAALRFNSLLRALGVLVAVSAGLLVGLMLIVTLFGLTAGGIPNV